MTACGEKEPAISVLLPARNAAATLPAALRSLLEQTPAPGCPLPDFEIIVVDDGSTDQTALLLQSLCVQAAQKNIPLRCLHLPPSGLAPALNAGLSLARGALIARMDADDTAHPHRLALQAAHLTAKPDLCLSASRVAFGGDPVRAGGFTRFVEWQNSFCRPHELARIRFRDTPVCHPSVMFRHEAAKQWGAYRHGDFPEDWELWLRWLDRGARMEKLPQTLLVWNDSPRRATRADSRYSRQACDRLRAFWLARHLQKNNPFHPQVWVLGAGRVARARLRPLWEYGPQPAAFIDIDPKKIGNRVENVPVRGRADLPPPGKGFLLNALTAHGAAEEAACWLEQAGYQDRDWLPA